MRVAIVGTGIAGNVAAYKLRDRCEITVYEAADYIGGHTNTVNVSEGDRTLAIDTGFIVFNDRTYPNFIQLLEEVGQPSQVSEMSFSVHAENDAIEYNGSSLNGLFAQRSNLLRPSFHRMVRDILRFNRCAVADIDTADDDRSLGSYLAQRGYGKEFIGQYLVPMVAAIWSAKPGCVLDMPVSFLVRFFQNHGLLQLQDRPQWRVISGGSRQYVERLIAGHRDRIRLNAPVRRITRRADGVDIFTDGGGSNRYDYVVLACHSDQALKLLAQPTAIEKEVLGAIQYQHNEAILHTDVRVLPRRRRAWASWNYYLPREPGQQVSVSYNMNILQSIDSQETYCVTLNDDARIAPEKIIHRVQYQHPMYTHGTVNAQARQADINCDRTFFCGAYWKNGFHEDGVVSALHAISHLEQRMSNAELHLRRAS